MPVLEQIVLLRGIERIVIMFGAITTIVVGAFVFKWGVSGTASLIAQANGFGLRLVNASPGIILCCFGTIVLGYALSQTTRAENEEKSIADGVERVLKTRFSYSSEEPEDVPKLLRGISEMDMSEPDSPAFRAKLTTLKKDAGSAFKTLTTGNTTNEIQR